jgi:hypothetical protein
MNKLFLLTLCLASGFMVSAQDSTVIGPLTDTVPQVIDTLPITDPSVLLEETQEENERKRKVAVPNLNLANRSKDHLLIQLGFDTWANMPDSINTRGLSRSFNMYFMFDFPFKTNPHLSVAIGAGIGTNNMYFKDTYIDIAGRNGNRLSFNDVSDTTRFKKYKLLTSFLEAPVEFRYSARPENPKKSFKAAIGAKIGTMLAASTKGKNLLNGAGQNINNFTQKEKSKKFFNTTRLSVTGRLGYGSLSIFGSYQVNSFIKEGFGPDVRPFSIGLTLSGL